MKKFLIGVLLIIPVIVVLVLNATGRIIKNSSPVNPSSIVVRDENGDEITAPIVLDVTETCQIAVDVLPSISYDHSVTYEIDDIEGSGDLRIERVGESNRYNIIPEKSGYTRVILRAKANVNARAALIVDITSRKINELSIYTADGTVREDLALYKPERLFCNIDPIEALSGNQLTWGTQDAKIAEISANGVVKPVGLGKTRVWVSAIDKTGTPRKQYIDIDTENALVSRDSVYVDHAVDAAWLKQNVVLAAGAEVSRKSESLYEVRSGDLSAEVQIVICDEDEWGFFETPDVIYTQNGPYFIDLRYYLTGEEPEDAVVYSSDPSVMKIVGNELVPVKGGQAELIAEADGVVRSMMITVKERPRYFSLNLNSDDAKLGIQQTRVWGQKFYAADGSITNTFQMRVEDDGTGMLDLRWTSDHPEYASVNENGLVTFHDAGLGQSVTITATALVHNFETNVKRSFTFNLLSDPASYNVYTTDQMFRTAAGRSQTIVLQSDVKIASTLYPQGEFYGNGFTVDARDWPSLGRYGAMMRYDRSCYDDPTRTIRVVDVAFDGAYTDAEHTVDKNDRGRAMVLSRMEAPMLLKNLIVQNTTDGINIALSKNIRMEGCIIGDVYSVGITYTVNPPVDGYKIVFRNNVFKEMMGPAISITADSFNGSIANQNGVPDVRIEGFMDVYSWKQTVQLEGLARSFGLDLGDLSGFIDPAALERALAAVLEDIFTQPEYSNMIYVDQSGQKYINLGIFVMGLCMKADPTKIVCEDNGFRLLPLTLPTKGNTGLLVQILELGIKAYDPAMTLMYPNYLLTYDQSADGGPRNKPGDPVPTDLELFERLNG